MAKKSSRKCRGANLRLVRRKRGKRKGKKGGGKKQSSHVFALCVHHPGTSAQPHLIPAWEVGQAFLKANLAKTIQKAGTKSETKLGRALNTLVSTSASIVLRQTQQRVPVDTTLLKESYNKRQRRFMFYTVGTNVVYAEGVEKGTKPHVILAKKKVLRFPRKGSRGRSRGSAR